MAALDPGAEVILALMDERLDSQATIAAQQQQIEALNFALRAQRRATCALGALADFLLTGETR